MSVYLAGPKILLRILFTNILNLCYFLRVRDQVSQDFLKIMYVYDEKPYKKVSALHGTLDQEERQSYQDISKLVLFGPFAFGSISVHVCTVALTLRMIFHLNKILQKLGNM